MAFGLHNYVYIFGYTCTTVPALKAGDSGVLFILCLFVLFVCGVLVLGFLPFFSSSATTLAMYVVCYTHVYIFMYTHVCTCSQLSLYILDGQWMELHLLCHVYVLPPPPSTLYSLAFSLNSQSPPSSSLPQQPLLRSILSRSTESFHPLYSSLRDQFELCLSKCRTSSQVHTLMYTHKAAHKLYWFHHVNFFAQSWQSHGA